MKPLEVAKGYTGLALLTGISGISMLFHLLGYDYNSFLIVDDRITLVDAVKKEFTDELLERISQIVDPKKIDFVISNHTEMDHSRSCKSDAPHRGRQAGLLLEDRIQESDQALSAEWNYKPVEDGGQLSLGREPWSSWKRKCFTGLTACLPMPKRTRSSLPAMLSASTMRTRAV